MFGSVMVCPPSGAWLTGYAASKGYSTYPGLGWLVLVRQPRDEALAPALYLQRVIVLVVLLVGAALVAMMVCAIRISARPLQDMARTADAITEQLRQQSQQAGRKTGTSKAVLQSQHQLQSYPSSSPSSSLAPIHVSLPPTHRRDEVGLLGASFSALLHVLNAHRAELQGLNAQLEAKVQSRTVELEMINRSAQRGGHTELKCVGGYERSITLLMTHVCCCCFCSFVCLCKQRAGDVFADREPRSACPARFHPLQRRVARGGFGALFAATGICFLFPEDHIPVFFFFLLLWCC
jgi:HAMP domain-containing protein